MSLYRHGLHALLLSPCLCWVAMHFIWMDSASRTIVLPVSLFTTQPIFARDTSLTRSDLICTCRSAVKTLSSIRPRSTACQIALQVSPFDYVFPLRTPFWDLSLGQLLMHFTCALLIPYSANFLMSMSWRTKSGALKSPPRPHCYLLSPNLSSRQRTKLGLFDQTKPCWQGLITIPSVTSPAANSCIRFSIVLFKNDVKLRRWWLLPRAPFEYRCSNSFHSVFWKCWTAGYKLPACWFKMCNSSRHCLTCYLISVGLECTS